MDALKIANHIYDGLLIVLQLLLLKKICLRNILGAEPCINRRKLIRKQLRKLYNNILEVRKEISIYENHINQIANV